MPQGNLIVVTGPSGVGKRTLISHLLAHEPNAWFSVSMTTREPREDEVDGRDYHFVDRDTFRRLIGKNSFLEYKEYARENFYGTPRTPVMGHLRRGKTVLLELEIQGALEIKTKMPDSAAIFLEPPEPAIETLRQRSIARGGMSPESLQRRLRTSQEELAQKHLFDNRIINDDVELAKAQMLALVRRIVGERAAA